MFPKKTLDVRKESRNGLVYQLSGERPLTLAFSKRLQLNQTEASRKFLKIWDLKKKDIDSRFYRTLAMPQNTWKEAACRDRHEWTKLPMHGSHYKLCLTNSFHNLGSDCRCRLCGEVCEQYHALSFQRNPQLRSLADDNNTYATRTIHVNTLMISALGLNKYHKIFSYRNNINCFSL